MPYEKSEEKNERMEHQKRCFEAFKDKDYGAIWLAPGTGKTLILLDLIQYKKPKSVLIVTKKSILKTIQSEINKWTNLSSFIISAENKNADFTGYDIVLVNYDMLLALAERFQQWQPEFIALDESSSIKNRNALRTKAALSLAGHARYKFCLDGTSVANTYEDWFTQYQFLNPSIMPRNITAFRNMYCPQQQHRTRAGRTYWKTVNYQYIFESNHPLVVPLMERVRPYTFAAKKEDCLDLPPKTYTIERVEMSPEQQRTYNQMKRHSLSMINGAEISSTVLIGRMMKMHQIANSFVYNDTSDEWMTLPGTNGKMEWLKDWLPGVVPEHKVVLFSRFLAPAVFTKSLLKDMAIPFAYLTSQMNPTERQEQLVRFASDPAVRVFVCPSQIGSHGINEFTVADYCIFLNNDYNSMTRIQAEDRLHRKGQDKNCHYIDLVTENSFEERILDALKNKKDVLSMSIAELSRLILAEEVEKGGDIHGEEGGSQEQGKERVLIS